MNISEDYKEKQSDKLIELLEQANKVCSKRFREETKAVLKQKGCFNSKTDRVENFNEITADHLIENGVIVPPCKVGDVVYLIGEFTHQIVCSRVTAIIYDDGGIWLALNGFLCMSINQSLGKTVFLTREEAEKALKGRCSNE